MKILLFGKNGQVGWELQRSLAPLGEMVALGSDSQNFCGDLSNLAGITQTIRTIVPDVIVNASAYTAVDKAESDISMARVMNAQAPGVLAEESKKCGACLIHYSTDYVFDGRQRGPSKEEDKTNPLNVYGVTKREGEQSIQSSGCSYFIFRCSWIYAARGNNFLKTILRLAQEREQLSIVKDQVGAPTGADLIADITAHILGSWWQYNEQGGLYHLAAKGETSWYEYACYILSVATHFPGNIKIKPDAVRPIAASEFPTRAQRPSNSLLDSTKLEKTFGLSLPSWQSGVARALSEILD